MALDLIFICLLNSQMENTQEVKYVNWFKLILYKENLLGVA